MIISYYKKVIGPTGDPIRDQTWLSDHFQVREFSCHCNRQACWVFPIDTMLVNACQTIRNQVGPLKITSGFRCEDHNKEVGGSENSMHRYGKAADIRTVSRENMDEALNIVSNMEEVGAIGRYYKDSKLVRLHIDFRSRCENGPVGWSKEE